MYQDDYGKNEQNQTGNDPERTEYRKPEESQVQADRERESQEREVSEGSQAGAGEVSGNVQQTQPGNAGSYGGSQASQPGSAGSYGGSQASQPGSAGGYGGSQASQPGSAGGYGGSQASQPGNADGYGSYGTGYGRQSNPYSYGNSGTGGSHGQQPQQSHQTYQHYAPWQQPSAYSGQQGQKRKKEKKQHPLAKRIAQITAAAVLFGVVAGGTMAGVNVAGSRLLGLQETEDGTKTTLAQAETLPEASKPAPSSNESTAMAVSVSNDVSGIVEKAMPSVVAINSVTQYQTQDWFGLPQVYEGRGSGSGIIVGESENELLIVTNNHVVEGAKTLGVVFADNEEVEANVKGTDSDNDLAVIAVDLSSIPGDTRGKIAVATLGDSDGLKVGQGVVAIGNALGYGQSVTVGYISALDREVKTDQGTTRNLLQTDAAINPGNSGGALLNMKGEVVGINSAKYSSTEVEGMGYAIPITKVQDIISTLMTKKTRVEVEQEKQGYLGIQGQDIDAETSRTYGMPQGVFVYKIIEGGAAASSNLKEKDIITKFDGQSVRSMAELKRMLSYYAGGDTVSLTVESLKDGQYVERQVEVTLGIRPPEESVN